MIREFALQLTDFLFPKPEEVYSLEELSAGALLNLLEPAREGKEGVITVFNYANPRVRLLIWELKYRHNVKIAANLASILFDVLHTEVAERALSENFVSPLLIPVPQSRERYLERGFNQTEVLCEEILKLDTQQLFEYKPHALTKISHTESQARTHSKKDRLFNVEGTMHVAEPDTVKGRNIIVLDDVTTTGATLTEAKRALRAAGAKKIMCVAIAH